MHYIIKPTVTCILWKILEEELGLEVGGNLSVDVGWVDLVAKDPTGEYIGLEVKDFSGIYGKSKIELRFANQILKYMISGYFDRFHVCVLTEHVQSLTLTLDPRRYLNPIYQFNYPDEYERFRKYGGYLDHCGILSIPSIPLPIKELDIDFPDLIKRYPKKTNSFKRAKNTKDKQSKNEV